RALFEDMKRSHQRSATKQLDAIANRFTGRAVLTEINSKSSFSVMILPFDFIPARDWSTNAEAETRVVEPIASKTVDVPKILSRPICKTKENGQHVCYGSGSSSDIYFTASRSEDDADE